MVDPQFVAEADKTGVEHRWFESARMKAVMQQMESAPEDVKMRVRQMLDVKG
jgi:hypothetical protein